MTYANFMEYDKYNDRYIVNDTNYFASQPGIMRILYKIKRNPCLLQDLEDHYPVFSPVKLKKLLKRLRNDEIIERDENARYCLTALGQNLHDSLEPFWTLGVRGHSQSTC